jgi:hypothetical protein|tara:strand:- start:393 stop:527 length:135 start_codon:yes stop_codon:yes gene_type:complete
MIYFCNSSTFNVKNLKGFEDKRKFIAFSGVSTIGSPGPFGKYFP